MINIEENTNQRSSPTLSVERRGASQDFCCVECFEHPWLQAMSQTNQSQSGQCFYCGSEGPLTPVSVLYFGFYNLLSDYIPAEAANGGRDSYFASVPVTEAVQRDWKVFSDRVVSDRLHKFLPAVFENQNLPLRGGLRVFTEPVVPFHRNAMSTAYGKWLRFWMVDPTAFSDWTHHNVPSDIDTIGTAVNQMSEHLRNFVRSWPTGRRLWRARRDYVGFSDWDCQPLPLAQMGHNPKCPASRLNREGEVVLYCAEAEKTAVAEIRPGRGNICTTCELVTQKELELLDLATSLQTINPFTCADLSWQLDLQRVARNLSAQIAIPTSRGEDPVVYNKCQALAMVVRAMKIDGIRFSSSLDAPLGTNIALFDPTVVTFSNARLIVATSAEIKYEPIQQNSAGSRSRG
jgi:hypothetical protein